MKKAGLLAALLLIVAATAFGLLNSRPGELPALLDSTPKVAGTLPTPLQTVRKDSMFALYLNRHEWQVLVDSLRSLTPKLEQLTLWKKFELPNVAAEIERALAEPSGDIEPWIGEAWEQLDAILLVAGSGRFSVNNQVTAPPILIQAAFRDPETATRLKTRINEELQKLVSDKLSVEAGADATAISINETDAQFQAVLDTVGSALRLRIGSTDPAAFLTTDPAEALPSSEIGTLAAETLTAPPAYLVLVSAARLGEWLRQLAEHSEEMKAAAAGFETAQAFRDTLMWGSFREGYRARYCALMTRDEPLTKSLRELYSANDTLTSDPLWKRFVSSETIFFMEYSAAQLWGQLEMLLAQVETVNKLEASGTPLPPDSKEALAKVRNAVNEARTFPLSKVALVVERNPVVVVPRGALILESTGTAEALIDRLGDLIEGNLPSEAGLTLKREKGGLAVSADTLTFSASVIDDKRVALVAQQTDLDWIRSSAQGQGRSPFLDAVGRELQPTHYDFLMLIHTSPILELARPFFTMGAGAAGHGVEPQDIDEAARLLEGFLVISAKSEFSSDSVLCTGQAAKIVSKAQFAPHL